MTTVLPLQDQVIYDIQRTDDSIRFYTTSNTCILMHHEQDCCESVYIEDINGDLDNLLHTPILSATEKTNQTDEHGDSTTFTFYTIRTRKGSVDITWRGESNGYYSESVDFSVTDFPMPAEVLALYKTDHPEHII